jgi:hypothetical protein
MRAVTEAVEALTPKAKPSPYAKRWWTTDLTNLRRTYTHWRNRARTKRRNRTIQPDLEQQARMARKEYHDAIRKQKRTHWHEFLDDSNIWQAAKYLNPDSTAAFDKVPPLTKSNGGWTESKEEQAEELLKTFFPPLPESIEVENGRQQRKPLDMPPLTVEEIE